MHLVIDGNNIMHMAYHAGKGVGIVNAENPTRHVKIMLNMLRKYVKEFKPDDIIVCWDGRPDGAENWRKTEAEDYKAGRAADDMIFAPIKQVMTMLYSLGIRQVFPKTTEADDIMYWLCAQKYPNDCILVSGDTDMYQLLNPHTPNFRIYNPRSKTFISRDILSEKYMVTTGREFIIRKALKGDSADNIKGVYRIRKDRIEKVINEVLKDDSFGGLKESGILNTEEYEVFANNMKLMDLSSILDNAEEIAWFESLLVFESDCDLDLFRSTLNELNLDDVAENAAWYCKPFKDIHTPDSDYVDISMYLTSY